MKGETTECISLSLTLPELYLATLKCQTKDCKSQDSLQFLKFNHDDDHNNRNNNSNDDDDDYGNNNNNENDSDSDGASDSDGDSDSDNDNDNHNHNHNHNNNNSTNKENMLFETNIHVKFTKVHGL